MSIAQDTGVEVLTDHSVRVCCRKCGEHLGIEFGDMTRAEAVEMVAKLDRIPRECPGFHVELSGWRHLWRLDEAIEALYPSEVSA